MGRMEPFVQTLEENNPPRFVLQPWLDQEPAITAGISSRLGGVSKAEMKSLNCALHVNDDVNDVMTNRIKLAEAIGYPFEAWTCADQVHSNAIQAITSSDKGRGRQSGADAIPF